MYFVERPNKEDNLSQSLGHLLFAIESFVITFIAYAL